MTDDKKLVEDWLCEHFPHHLRANKDIPKGAYVIMKSEIFVSQGWLWVDNPTWKDIFNNFKSVYPRLSKEAQDYRPYNYMSIVVYLADGTKVVYDDMTKRAKMLAA